MTYNKKLIEVALPLEAINAASKSDKESPFGTIKNLHKWFAPMPLPALRALILASIIDDPGDLEERAKIFAVIESLVAGGATPPDSFALKAALRLIDEATEGHPPVVLDPFCGGGSTLVEAQRLGLRSIGSDLNPVPALISRAVATYPAQLREQSQVSAGAGGRSVGLSGFRADVVHYASVVRSAAEARIGHHYPEASPGAEAQAWWWCRTAPCPDPRYKGLQVPIVESWWLTRPQWLEYAYDESSGFTFTVRLDGSPPPSSKNVCPVSGAPMPFKYLRECGMRKELGTMLLAVATAKRNFVAPNARHLDAAAAAAPADPPSAPLPEGGLGFRVQNYGMDDWAELFLPRQQLALETFAEEVASVADLVRADGGSEEQAIGISLVLGLCVGKLAQQCSTAVRWRNQAGKPIFEAAFGQAILPMMWDFAESNPFASTRGWTAVVDTALGYLKQIPASGPPSQVLQADARTVVHSIDEPVLVVSDPPYFASIGYADLSDYFYIWERRALRSVQGDVLQTLRTPKQGELIADKSRHGDSDGDARSYFVDGFTETFKGLRTRSDPRYPMLIVYAYKEQESGNGESGSGWSAMLEAILRAGLAVTGTWPIHGTGSARMRGRDANALATYVVLACRPRSVTAGRVTQKQFIEELRLALRDALPALQAASIAPVDLDQAVLGPGIAVFSQHSSVLRPDESALTVRDALLLINVVKDEILEEQEGDLDADSRWAVTWYEQHGFGDGPFGSADGLARSKVTTVDGLVRSGIVQASAGNVRLIQRSNLPLDYDPRNDERPTAWEAVQHLVKALDTSETRAAELLARLGTQATMARDLAYRLFQMCQRSGRSEEAQAYNQLVGSWTEISRLADDFRSTDSTLF